MQEPIAISIVQKTNHNTPSPSVILGIDPGYERCGFAILEHVTGHKEILQYSDCFKTSATLPFEDRLLLIGSECERLIKTYAPNVCALEKVYFTSNQKTAMHVAEVRGVLLYLTKKYNLHLLEYTPNEIKVAIAGDGGADKRQIMYMVPKLVALTKTIKYDDEYDAIAVALTASACASVTCNTTFN
ncbi:MAG: crossover junction endodeoxyribonuclease RuvC [Candidatus Pacebacteria bacterium]|nr:crossover junction endodeoxyribonuclease RuvC [Candidatus Paceibacterota bacterium]